MTSQRRGAPPRLKASGIVETVGLAKIGVMALPDQPGVASVVLGAIGKRGINAPFVVELADPEGRSSIVFCVAQDRLQEACLAIAEVADRVHPQQVVHQSGVVLVAVYGPHFRDRPGGAAQAFTAIASAGVNILAISTSVSSISCVVEEAHLAAVVDALKAAFEVPDSAVLIGNGELSRPVRRGR